MSALWTGPAALLFGSFLFAGANVLAKVVYWRGVSQVSLFIMRGLAVYVL